jgi:hypothetical protein
VSRRSKRRRPAPEAPEGGTRAKSEGGTRAKPSEAGARPGARGRTARPPEAGGPATPPPRRLRGPSGLVQALILVAAFGIAVGVAELAGAANLGVAFGVGQIVFAITLVILLLRG